MITDLKGITKFSVNGQTEGFLVLVTVHTREFFGNLAIELSIDRYILFVYDPSSNVA